LFYHTIYLTSKTYYSFKSFSSQSTTFLFNLYSKFCSQTLKDDEKQFTNTMAKLNVNIIYLCLFKHVPLTNVLPKHTLENIFFILLIILLKWNRGYEKSRKFVLTFICRLFKSFIYLKRKRESFAANVKNTLFPPYKLN
jgi:hypothetical protein